MPVRSHSLRRQPLCSGGGDFHFLGWLGLVGPLCTPVPYLFKNPAFLDERSPSVDPEKVGSLPVEETGCRCEKKTEPIKKNASFKFHVDYFETFDLDILDIRPDILHKLHSHALRSWLSAIGLMS